MTGKHSKKGFDKKIGNILLIAFAVFTLAVKFVGVAAIGPEGSKVGFSGLNKAVFDALGTSGRWFAVAEGVGYAALLVCAGFALQGLFQLITRRSFKKVDPGIYALGALYIVTIALYLVFNVIPVNYRPVLVDGVLEPSYPSSHTMLAIVVFVSAAIERQRYSNKSGLSFTGIVCIALTLLCVAARLLSGVHWITDIIGAVILAAALLEYYMELRELLEKKLGG